MVEPLDDQTVGDRVRGVGHRGVLARGLGRSYGDAAQNSGGLVLSPSVRDIRVDENACTVAVSAGTSLHDLVSELLPRGLFLPVVPGTRQVTVGGAIAADVHGKNHFRAGSFADHLISFDLVGPDGTSSVVTPDSDAELFWATTGGMGLTGVITRAVLRVRPLSSAYVTVSSERLPNLSALLSRMAEASETHEYAAAWVDLIATGHSLGRSVLGSGDHSGRDELAGWRAEHPLAAPRSSRVQVPLTPPGSLVNRLSTRAFNELWFRRGSAAHSPSVVPLGAHLNPLDAFSGWNRLYGPRGLVQYQFVVPAGTEDLLREVVARIATSGRSPFLGVLKRLGPANRGWLSFPIAGWTLAVDFPASARLVPLFRELETLVLRADGRVYLAKDSFCGPDAVRAMYPRAEEYRARRAATGADQVFVSDLSRRLRL